jgi:hypothetical protein
MQSFHPGYHLHFIQVRRLALAPWGWRPGLVAAVDSLTLDVAYLDGGSVTVWHHEPVQDVEVGLPVRVHEQYRALEIGRTWYHVRPTGGLGPVPEPEHLDDWNAAAAEPVVVELSTGRALRVAPLG